MNVTVITPPPFEPVTLADCYRHLRLEPDHEGSPSEWSHPDDPMLEAHITAAREFVEKMTRRSLVQQRLRLSCVGFPLCCWSGLWWPRGELFMPPDRIELQRPPVQHVDRVSYFDASNAATEIDPADYYVTDDLVPQLLFATAFAPPVVYGRGDAVRVEYTAGYAPEGSPTEPTQEAYAANVPEPLKQAILLTVQLLYDNLAPLDREAIERMREALVQPYRIQLAP
jgi:uncharacterized phiE125 gp8 family phage protein